MANGITEDTTDVTGLLNDEQMLKKVQDAITGILSGGQSYTLFGSRTVTKGDLKELRGLLVMYQNRVLAKRGETRIHQTDFRKGV